MKPHLFRLHNWWFCRVGTRTYPAAHSFARAYENYYRSEWGLLGP